MSESTPNPCARCGQERTIMGGRLRCRRCHAEWQRNRKAGLSPEQRETERARGEELRSARRKAWSPERRAAEYARSQAWRDADPERHRAGSRDWYKRNVEFARAQKLAEYRRNPEAFYAQNEEHCSGLSGVQLK